MNEIFNINDNIPHIEYIANGSECEYIFPFLIFSSEDIIVYINQEQTHNNFTVSYSPTSIGGKVTFAQAPAKGSEISIVRDLDIRRVTDFQEGGSIRSRALNHEFNYQMACSQQLADALNRALILPPYTINTNFKKELPIPEAQKAIVWNAEANALTNSKMNILDIDTSLHEAMKTTSITKNEVSIMHKDIIIKHLETLENAKQAKGVDIGTILPSSKNIVPNGGLWCNGDEWLASQFPDFFAKLVNAEIKSVDYTTYNQAILDAGWCGVCGIDIVNQTFKAPKITNAYQINIIPNSKNKNLGRTIIETQTNLIDNTWYNLYSDGWLEQGGYDNEGTIDNALRTIIFPISFANTSYNVLITKQSENRNNDLLCIGSYANKNTDSFTRRTSCYPLVVGVNWRAEGYAEHPIIEHNSNYYIVIYNKATDTSISQTADFINSLSNKSNVDADNFTTIGKANILSLSTLTANHNRQPITWGAAFKLPYDSDIWGGGFSLSNSDDISIKISDNNLDYSNILEHDAGYIFIYLGRYKAGSYIKSLGGHSYQSLFYSKAGE